MGKGLVVIFCVFVLCMYTQFDKQSLVNIGSMMGHGNRRLSYMIVETSFIKSKIENTQPFLDLNMTLYHNGCDQVHTWSKELLSPSRQEESKAMYGSLRSTINLMTKWLIVTEMIQIVQFRGAFKNIIEIRNENVLLNSCLIAVSICEFSFWHDSFHLSKSLVWQQKISPLNSNFNVGGESRYHPRMGEVLEKYVSGFLRVRSYQVERVKMSDDMVASSQHKSCHHPDEKGKRVSLWLIYLRRLVPNPVSYRSQRILEATVSNQFIDRKISLHQLISSGDVLYGRALSW